MPRRPLLILGSGSARRRELLAPFFQLRILQADIDESPKSSEKARVYTRRMAVEKFHTLSRRLSGRGKTLLLTADTSISFRGRVVGKPDSRQEAEKILRAFSGDRHEVLTAVSLGFLGEKPKSLLVSTRVEFRKIEKRELDQYLRSREWQGKAGAYGIQGKAAIFVKDVRGSLTNVIGLPVDESLRLLREVIRRGP
ncbi:MAG: septum formation protein Maf [Bradymonadales bacterium]|nr:MAG: septum formation protein Maf [Bradymonadales bacterium]